MTTILWLLGMFLAYPLVEILEHFGEVENMTPGVKTLFCALWPITSLSIIVGVMKNLRG